MCVFRRCKFLQEYWLGGGCFFWGEGGGYCRISLCPACYENAGDRGWGRGFMGVYDSVDEGFFEGGLKPVCSGGSLRIVCFTILRVCGGVGI